MPVNYIERDITPSELTIVKSGFEDNNMGHGNPVYLENRITFVAISNNEFIGCVSGLRGDQYYYLSDLWIEPANRKSGIGKTLLSMWEQRIFESGCKNIYTWTAGFEAPDFYKRQGYAVFGELENYYPSGHSRIGFKKSLK